MKESSKAVQSTEICYDLHSLGWKAFQDLCTTIVSDVLGQTVQTFLPSKDGGRDGAFNGTWHPINGQGIRGSFVVQCKFTGKRDKTLSLSAINDELFKARQLASKGFCDNYILMTNFQVSGETEANIRSAFNKIPAIQNFIVFGNEWITLKIRESSRLRILVPRVYGLGDLSQILDERAYSQAKEMLNSMGDDLAKFVVTEAYKKSANALINHGFVLLLGEPASGKSMIAASLAVGSIDRWESTPLKIRNASEFIQHWNPHEPRQFFWIDDAFGTTHYQATLANEWNTVFQPMAASIKKGARILFTSRDYIYRAALSDLKLGTFPLINESQVVINVQQLSIEEKQQILYNHMKMGDQPSEFRKLIKSYLPIVASNHRFLPEIARRLGTQFFTRKLSLDLKSITEFVEKPLPFLVEVVRTLSASDRAAIAMIFMNGGTLDSPLIMTPQTENTSQLLGVSEAKVRRSLSDLNDSLVKRIQINTRPKWTFKHPTVGDAFASVVADDPELLDLYLAGTQPNNLINEVACGITSIQGVKVIVPETRYGDVIKKLNDVEPSAIYSFLASRCDPCFIKLYVQHVPSLFSKVLAFGSYLSAYSEVRLIARLNELNLLPKDCREEFLQKVRYLSVNTPDVDFLSFQWIRDVFTEDELANLLEIIKSDLIPNLSDEIDIWESNYEYNKHQDTEDYFNPFKEALQVLSVAAQAV